MYKYRNHMFPGTLKELRRKTYCVTSTNNINIILFRVTTK